jgi:hypothetical protein
MRIGTPNWPGQLLSAAGGTGIAGSLWLTWYTGRLRLTAWQAFTAMPSVLLVTGALVALLSVLELSGRAGDTSSLAILAGGLAALLVGYRLAEPPLGLLRSAWGPYLTLGSALVTVAGGMLAAAHRSLPEISVPAIGVEPAPAAAQVAVTLSGISAPPAP